MTHLQSTPIWHVLTRDHTVLPDIHTFIHKWNQPYLPLLPSCRASPHFGWYSFPVLSTWQGAVTVLFGWVGNGRSGFLLGVSKSILPAKKIK